MAGPSFLHVRDSDDVVIGVFSTTRTPSGGVTEFNETHPIFIPAIKSTRWERQGVNTYADIGEDASNPPPEEKDFMTWVQGGGIENPIAPTGVTIAAWGHEESLTGVKMFRDGEILGWSAVFEGVITAGTMTYCITNGGVAVNDVTYELLLDNTTSDLAKSFVTPISFDVGDIMSAQVTTAGMTFTGGDDTTLSVWYRDR